MNYEYELKRIIKLLKQIEENTRPKQEWLAISGGPVELDYDPVDERPDPGTGGSGWKTAESQSGDSEDA